MNLEKTMAKRLKAVTLNQCWLHPLRSMTVGFHSQGRAQAILRMSFLQDPTLESSTIGQFSTFSLYFFWAYYLLDLGMRHLLLVWKMTRPSTKGFHLPKRLMQLGMYIAWGMFYLLGWLQGVVALQLIVEVPPGKLPRILAHLTAFHSQLCLVHIIPLLGLRLFLPYLRMVLPFWPTTLPFGLGTLVVPFQQTSILYWLALHQVSTTAGK